MKYQVLARKYRPKTFSSMMGQEHVLKALSNALESERLHHAYLFTGTRGVGKTTVARVLAKALNCEQGISATPCGECPACQEIEQGRFVDLIEVDAASRTKVEDTRELLDNVQYAPTRGRFKIYLIDEVHMLSGHSFNALLKTLEEPPPHVKFLLATTDPQKLPVTILSRCLQFNLKRLNIEQIEQQLDQILNAEGITFEPGVLKPLAIAADGSMRDALSLLDQSIAYSNGQPKLTDVEAMLGSVQKDRIFELLTALANEEGQTLIEQSRILTGQGIDANTILAELITTLQRIAMGQMVPEAIDDSLGDKQAILQLAQAISPEDIQLYYQIALNGRKDLPFSPQPQGGFEMILLRMLAFKPVSSGSNEKLEAPKTETQQGRRQPDTVNAVSGLTAEKKTPENLKLTSSQNKASVKPPEPLLSEPVTAEIVTAEKTELSKQSEDVEVQPITPEKKLNEQLPGDLDLPPVDAYGQDYFHEPDENEIPLFDDLLMPESLSQQPEISESSPNDVKVEDANLNHIHPQEQPTDTLHADRESMQVENSETEQLTSSETESFNTEASPGIEKSSSRANIPCEQVGELADFWHDLIQSSEIKGLEQQLAKHCALIHKTEQSDELSFELLLESVHKHLLNDKILNRLIESLETVLGKKLNLNIKECQFKAEEQLQTPRRREIHEAEVLQQQAVESIAADPKIRLMMEAFGATVREETIKPIQ